MVPRRSGNTEAPVLPSKVAATRCDSGSKPPAKACAHKGKEPSETDSISVVSTKESEGILNSPAAKEGERGGLQKWTTIPARKKKVNLQNEKVQAQHEEVQAPHTPSKRHEGKYSSGDGVDADFEEVSHSRSHEGKGKGKGLSYFQRIKVGIEDDPEFRVVQRLIGPRGKHMQDVVVQCKGSKVWIIGQSSCSWEDSVGPLMICVGATRSSVFDTALGLVTDLLRRVREDHSKIIKHHGHHAWVSCGFLLFSYGFL
jgi:hypothetical protein